MEIGAIYKETAQRLNAIYGDEESISLVNILFQDLLGIDRIHRIRKPQNFLENHQIGILKEATEKLLNHVPIQQITGFTYFLGRKFSINEHVLIPRPETEELVILVKKENTLSNPRILDIGTGSGCIPISLSLEISKATVFSVDISVEAIAVAQKNANELNAMVHFQQMDILRGIWEDPVDILVSNPPYIPFQERSRMNKNVTEYEPEIALFVPDDDPLIFYRRIGDLGQKCLNPGGKIYVEIHENFAKETALLFKSQNFSQVLIHQDLNGKNRMVSAIRL